MGKSDSLSDQQVVKTGGLQTGVLTVQRFQDAHCVVSLFWYIIYIRIYILYIVEAILLLEYKTLHSGMQVGNPVEKKKFIKYKHIKNK